MAALLVCICLVTAGLGVFCITGGIVLYKGIFLKKPAGTGALDKPPEGMKNLIGHTSDSRIMDPIMAAKRRWESYPVEEVSAVSFDGTLLAGYIWPSDDTVPEGDKGRIKLAYLIHGFTDSAAGMAYLAEEYRRRGFTVFAPDCRAHGKSGGTRIGMGYPDAGDTAVWMDFLEKRFGEDCRIILHGVSMGGAAALIYGGGNGPCPGKHSGVSPCVRLIISDASFSSYHKEALYQLRCIIPGNIIQPLLRRLLTAAASLICRVDSGFFFGRAAPVKGAARCTVPLVFFHGGRDALVPADMCRELFDAAGVEKEMALVPDAPHIGSYFYDPENYFRIIMEKAEIFLQEESGT